MRDALGLHYNSSESVDMCSKKTQLLTAMDDVLRLSFAQLPTLTTSTPHECLFSSENITILIFGRNAG